MNDERFIEMLNLYIDRELSGAEIDEIEEAIASSPERQKIYAQYCRIERATQHLLNETDVPQPRIAELIAAARSDDNTVEFEPAPKAPKTRWLGWGTSVASLAAACLAIVFIMQPADEPAGETAVAAPAVETAVPAFIDDSAYQTVFVLDDDRSSDRLERMRPASDSFAWMNQLQFAPIERSQIDSWQMEASEPIEVRSLNPRWITPVGLDDTPGREEMTAFQFQR